MRTMRATAPLRWRGSFSLSCEGDELMAIEVKSE
jgi:hypothetical protein